VRQAPEEIEKGALCNISLGEWMEDRGFGRYFRERFLLPMGGAIWSTPADRMRDFPAESFIGFFRNHDLMTGLESAMQWRTVDGGSREYVLRALRNLGPRARAGLEVVRVDRASGRPLLTYADGSIEAFDQVVLAGHSDQNLAMLSDPDAEERAVLSAVRYSPNRAVLHRDPALMPKRRKVWSSWNFLSLGFEQDAGRPAAVTYWMNRLQGLDSSRDLFVSLNPPVEPDPEKVFASFDYAHPQFDQAAFEAQGRIDAIQGRGGVWHAGAWLGYGFHEDGLKSGLRVAAALGARPVWARDPGEVAERQYAVAAE
jgi:predicted NAD/FAD-binding protein